MLKFRTSGEGGGFENPDKVGQGEGVVWKSQILADVLSRWPLRGNFLILFFCKNSFGRACLNIFTTILGQKSKIWNLSENFSVPEKNLRGIFFIFRKHSFRRIRFNIFPTILAQKTKIEKFPRGTIFIVHFLQKFFRKSTFQHISDHSRPKNKNRKFEIFAETPRKVPRNF